MNQLQKDIKALSSLDVNKHVRKATGKCEENVKIKIVIPLLELLGYNPQQDMDFEHHVESKRADIALLVDNKPKLLVETKDLDESLDIHIQQALNYAFSKGIEWVVLTNGLEIRIYKSFIPNISHKDRLLFATSLSNLTSTFDALFEYIGKEHLLEAKKLTETEASVRESITAKILIQDLTECRERLFADLLSQFKSRHDTDKEFRVVIDTWAKSVKMDISTPDSIEKLCREGAYTLINRVLFLRICEDKGHIKAKLSKDAITKWRQMVEKPTSLLGMAFDEIGERFESLYKAPLFDSINFGDIQWKADTINFVLDKLGEHDFAKISKDILGRAYEKHISREERKRLGQFYTPDIVIDYILDQIGILPAQKIIDPACGSGGFLMKAYDRLKKQYIEEGWPEDRIHSQILEQNLFGIDINPFATQLTVMNLLLKDLEHPTNIRNIVEGDSLDKIYDGLDMDILHTEAPISRVTRSMTKVSLVEMLRNRPFDVVVENPPYIGQRTFFSKEEKKRLKEEYSCATGRYETYHFFIERGIDIAKQGGFLGFIVPHTWLELEQAKSLRNYVLDTCKVVSITSVQAKVFEASVDNVIVILQKESDSKARDSNIVRIVAQVELGYASIRAIPQADWRTNRDQVFDIYLERESMELIKKIEKNCVKMGAICDVRDGVIAGRTKDIAFSTKKLDNSYHKILFGKDVDRYKISWGGMFVCRDKARLTEIELERTGNQGVGLRLRDDEIFKRPKILTRKTADRLIASYDEENYFYEQTLHGTSVKSKSYEIKYILALLNSSLFDWYYRNHPFQKKRTFPQVRISMLKSLPIKKASSQEQNTLVELVDKMLLLKKQLHTDAFNSQKDDIQKEIRIIDQEIDDRVCDLYMLDEREVETIKSKTT